MSFQALKNAGTFRLVGHDPFPPYRPRSFVRNYSGVLFDAVHAMYLATRARQAFNMILVSKRYEIQWQLCIHLWWQLTHWTFCFVVWHQPWTSEQFYKRYFTGKKSNGVSSLTMRQSFVTSTLSLTRRGKLIRINPLNPELNLICYLLALLGAHHFLHVSSIRVKSLTFRRLMSYIYGASILDVFRSHTTTQHRR